MDIEPSMNATSSRVPTAKSGFGCQKKFGTLAAKKKFGTIPAKNKNIGMIVPDMLFRNML